MPSIPLFLNSLPIQAGKRCSAEVGVVPQKIHVLVAIFVFLLKDLII